ncbi:DUF1648 domain-containing protein [Streptomyces sp. NPDC056411]|uniref:DUF1648 domain-containing protein n=1 Tax=Streptomyces sp. NPDC056411 TaxID=3345813 RepID=UPI0035DEC2A8
MVFSSRVRLWLLPNAVLLAALIVWGIARYPHLPGRLPAHIGSGGVDAWTDRSVGSAFGLVFLYLGGTVLLTACAELTLRVTPRAELPDTGAASFATGLAGATLNRPRTRASALRCARSTLLLNSCLGVSMLVGCGVMWRSAPDPRVPGWSFAALVTPMVIGTALMVAAAVSDRRTAA